PSSTTPGTCSPHDPLRTATRPPRMTLFHYTTLFRSQDQGRKRNNCFTSVWSDARPERHVWGSAWCYLETSPGGSLSNSAAKLLRDRKSTRLNSSHGSISYAVFCLNKKLL